MKNYTLYMLFILFLTGYSFGQSSWTQQFGGTSNDLYSVKFTDTLTGIAVGNNGFIIKTINGGSNWFAETSGTTQLLRGISMLNGNIGYVVGYNGTIRKTTNGGINWFALTSGVSNNLMSIYCVDVNTAYICGYGGLILKTTNGGINWSQQATGTTNNFNSIHFTNSEVGSAVGELGTVRRTTNGGLNWFAQSVSINGPLTAVYLNNLTNGIISIGYINMAFYRTTNSGVNWVSQFYGSDNSIRSIDFPDDTHGFMGGDNGNFYQTTNGGANWVRTPMDVTNWMYGISFVSDKVGWAVGTGGMILKTVTGGATIPNAPSNLVGFPINGSEIFLAWFDNSRNEQGFKIERSINSPNSFIPVGAVSPNTLNFIDDNLVYGNTYYYRVYAYSPAGNSAYSNTVVVLLTGLTQSAGVIPKEYFLYNNYPNPFNPSTKIKFDIPGLAYVKIKVYDISGKEIGLLLDSRLNPGSYEIEWNGEGLPSGTYLFKLETDDFTDIKKMTLIK